MPDSSDKTLSNDARDTSSPSRDSIAYWRQRVYRPVSVRGGRRIESVYWAVQIQCRGARKTLSLHTPDKGTAAAKARDIYVKARMTGWASALKHLRPETRSHSNYERIHKRLLLLEEELSQRPNGDRLNKRFWEIVRGIGCTCCGFNKWPLILQLHHIDKNRENNSLENLTVLCPNCHRALHHKVEGINFRSLAQLLMEHGLIRPEQKLGSGTVRYERAAVDRYMAAAVGGQGK